MPEENRVFDVAKPGHGSPQATSKPVIVGHSPTMSDPMMRSDMPEPAAVPETTHINVFDHAEDKPKLEVVSDSPVPEEVSQDSWSGQFGENSNAEAQTTPEIQPPVTNPEPVASTSSQPESSGAVDSHEESSSEAVSDEPIIPTEQFGHVEGLHVSPPKRKSPLLLILAILLVLVIGAYLFIDSGVVKTSINLPFHVFKQKAVVATPPVTAKQPATAVVPTGFTQYKIANTTVTFAAPTNWGTPTSSTDPGYTVRDATNKSTGTYAYLVDFATNKDVQIVVTSSKYLPPARSTLYYDFLQWCTGTNDGKTYLSVLKYTTTNKVDTATTVSCDQGPLTDATKLDSTTIVELKAKDATGAVAGDLYTKNINGGDIVVFRVKDKAMASSVAIKQLLNTVKATAAASTSSSSGASQ